MKTKKKVFIENWKLFVPEIKWRPKKRSSPKIIKWRPKKTPKEIKWRPKKRFSLKIENFLSPKSSEDQKKGLHRKLNSFGIWRNMKLVSIWRKLENAAKVGVDKGKFEPLSPTILTKCTPVLSRALNFRSRIYGQIEGTIKLISLARVCFGTNFKVLPIEIFYIGRAIFSFFDRATSIRVTVD